MTGTVTASSVEAPIAPAPKVQTIDEIIISKSKEYGVSETTVRQVIKCESSGNPNAVGDGGNSFGLVQIHLPSHPYVSKEEALNPEFAIDFLTKNLSQGKGRMWTCYRMMRV